MTNNLLTEGLSEPLDGATAASLEIHSGAGNLIVDNLDRPDGVLASATLQYFEKQGKPIESYHSDAGKAILTLTARDTGRPWFRIPWQACFGETEWQIHVNPQVPTDITAHSDGGNVKLNLADVAVTHVSADTGGGNMKIVLPHSAANLMVTAKTGAGNVTVDIGENMVGSNTVQASSGAGNVAVGVPSGVAARIQATTGLGKVEVEPRFSRLNRAVYQSPEFDSAVDKVEITIKSGAGNVKVYTN